MNTTLDRLTSVEIASALERADKRTPAIRIVERSSGFVRAAVACAGTCGLHDINGGEHDVVLWHDGRITCDCVAVAGLCYHVAALITSEGGALPSADEGPDRSYLPTPECREMCTYGTPALFADGGNGHGGSCIHADDEAYRLPMKEIIL